MLDLMLLDNQAIQCTKAWWESAMSGVGENLGMAMAVLSWSNREVLDNSKIF